MGSVDQPKLRYTLLAEACGVTTDWILTGRTADEGRA